MPPIAPLLLPLLLLLPLPASSDASFFEILTRNNLPAGLLPRTVKSFRISDDGNFEVELEGPCTARFENDVRYEATVSGNISYGQIGALRGVSAQELFLWFPVKGIRVEETSSGIVFFDVGVIYKQFSRSLFDTPPECHRVEEGQGVLAEGYNAARIAAKGQWGKLRYALDNNEVTNDAIQ